MIKLIRYNIKNGNENFLSSIKFNKILLEYLNMEFYLKQKITTRK